MICEYEKPGNFYKYKKLTWRGWMSGGYIIRFQFGIEDFNIILLSILKGIHTF